MSWYEDIKVWATGGETVKDMQQVKATLKGAQKMLTRARDYGLLMNPEAAADFREQTAGLHAKMGKMISIIDGGGKAVDRVQSLARVKKDAERINAAMRALSFQNGEIMRHDPEAAITAFGVLFHGLGGFAQNLPEPGKAYGKAMQAIGENLCKVYKMMDPNLREGWGGPQLKQLKEEGLNIGM